MSRADAWSDAMELCNMNSLPLWSIASEVAMNTSLTKDEAEGRLAAAIVAEVGGLLFEFGDYGKDGEDD